jgi:LacI family transcriptional regulator, gluconate utilization system Gnt-I transcriptional repressor
LRLIRFARYVIVANPIQASKSLSGSALPRRGHGRVTLADVAAFAGVTAMTVSRYLRSPERVGKQTAKQIAQALDDTGYTPNLQAGSLASGRSQAVAVIVPNIAHSIFADTLHGLGTGLQAAGLQMLVSSTGYSLGTEEQQIRTVLGWAPAALVVTGRMHSKATEQLLLAAQERGTPVVEIWDQSPAGEPHAFQQIGFNHLQAGAMMAQALIERGYVELCFVDSSVEEDFRAHERARGFVSHAQACGISLQLCQALAGDPVDTGGACFRRWYLQRTSSSRTGIGFANDLLATGALLQAQEIGCRIPNDIGLLGFGDFPVGRYCLGGLSTIHIDGERIGQCCADFIAQRLREQDTLRSEFASQTVFTPRLLWRYCET